MKTLNVAMVATLILCAASNLRADDLTSNEMVAGVTPSYINYVKAADWKSNWFVGVQGGINTFVGNPIGCGDFFDRTSFGIEGYAGKWVTSTVGLRTVYQGWKFKDSNLESNGFFAIHGDFMYDLASLFRSRETINPRWHFSPFVGVGIAKGKDAKVVGEGDLISEKHYPFIIAYGFNVQCRVSKRLHITGEIGNFTTFADFDWEGAHDQLKDNMLSASLGLAVTIGDCGHRHPIDARPYIIQNDYLIQKYVNKKTENISDNTEKTDSTDRKVFDDYSGLQSLRNRLKRRYEVTAENLAKDSLSREGDTIFCENHYYNIPILFFFKMGTSILTDKSQLVNLDELVKLTKQYGLRLKVVGAADSATGNTEINERLSKERCQYLTAELNKRGVDVENIISKNVGGVSEYKRPEENRYASVVIYIDMPEPDCREDGE